MDDFYKNQGEYAITKAETRMRLYVKEEGNIRPLVDNYIPYSGNPHNDMKKTIWPSLL